MVPGETTRRTPTAFPAMSPATGGPRPSGMGSASGAFSR